MPASQGVGFGAPEPGGLGVIVSIVQEMSGCFKGLKTSKCNVVTAGVSQDVWQVHDGGQQLALLQPVPDCSAASCAAMQRIAVGKHVSLMLWAVCADSTLAYETGASLTWSMST